MTPHESAIYYLAIIHQIKTAVLAAEENANVSTLSLSLSLSSFQRACNGHRTLLKH